MRVIAAIMIVAIILLLSSCLWVFMEKYDYITDVVVNNTDKDILILNYRSNARSYSDKIPPETIPLLPRIDSVILGPNSELCLHSSKYGGGCKSLDFKRIVKNEFQPEEKILFSDSIHIFYRYIDSVEIIFNNQRRLSIVNDNQSWEFTKLNEFWLNGRSDQNCNRKKGCCTCIFTYFITDEMYELAEPIHKELYSCYRNTNLHHRR